MSWVITGGERIQWPDLPAHVRYGVEVILGAAVVSAQAQSGGFSPGSADRVLLDDGRRAFVKAVSAETNADSLHLHRVETAVAATLPPDLPMPVFLGSYDSGDWVALCFAEVTGRQPVTPWVASEITAVLAALALIAATPQGSLALPNPPVPEFLAADFAGWERIAADPPAQLPPPAEAHLEELRLLAAAAPAASEGNSLCHLDIRADNVLITGDGSAVIVDWPWTALGAPWIDSLMLLINVGLYGGHDLEKLLAATNLLKGVDPAQLNALLAGLAGFFVNASVQPDPPGLPTLRRFQREQGDVVLDWLSQRLNW